MIYFERLTPTRRLARAHIQTPCDPLRAAGEFSWDHPFFRGLLEVSVQSVINHRPCLTSYLVQVDGPGCCRLMVETTELPGEEALA
ncbi:MAG: hypothetical protein ACOY93_17830 [Bacillota bacterium]